MAVTTIIKRRIYLKVCFDLKCSIYWQSSSELDEDSEPQNAKGPRMKTNKVRKVPALGISPLKSKLPQRKTENFYTHANVKNKNRQKLVPLKSRPVGQGKRREFGPTRRKTAS